MKKTLPLLWLSVIFAAPAFAQMHDNEINDYKKHEYKEHRIKKGDMNKMCVMIHMCLKHADKLGLSVEQVDKLKIIHHSMDIKVNRFQAEKKIANIELSGIIEVKDFNLKKANTALQKISNIGRNQQFEILKAMKAVRSVLTDDQFVKLNKYASGYNRGGIAEFLAFTYASRRSADHLFPSN